MLLLTRRIGQGIRIGDHIQVKVLAHRNNQIRLGIEAPKDIPVHRDEVFERIQHEHAAEHAAEARALATVGVGQRAVPAIAAVSSGTLSVGGVVRDALRGPRGTGPR